MKSNDIKTITIENKTFGEERPLYNLKNADVLNCKFEGEEDGESALKECSNIYVFDTLFALRYPLWHCNDVILEKIKMYDTCRASMWYDKNISIIDSELNGIKALRECSKINITNTTIVSAEFGWRSKEINMHNVSLNGEYVFFECKKLRFSDFTLNGKYSFQYTNDVLIKKSTLNTKDAFWHSKNATLIDCELNGEYLAWYSENLTLINCVIKGTQPLCYCKNLRLINCQMPDCDLAFEYSSVKADLCGTIKSIKNPKSGFIKYENCEEIILKDSKYPTNKCKILKK